MSKHILPLSHFIRISILACAGGDDLSTFVRYNEIDSPIDARSLLTACSFCKQKDERLARKDRDRNDEQFPVLFPGQPEE